VGFVANEVALEDVSLRVLWFSHQHLFTKAFIQIPTSKKLGVHDTQER
jgi:hypothetical protein